MPDTDQRLIVYCAEPGSATHATFRRLAGRADATSRVAGGGDATSRLAGDVDAISRP